MVNMQSRNNKIPIGGKIQSGRFGILNNAAINKNTIIATLPHSMTLFPGLLLATRQNEKP
jgi:hypothetical protein